MNLTHTNATDSNELSGLLSWTNYILTPFICGVGLVGNSMAILLIQNNSVLKRMPSNTYLSYLALFSSLFLVSQFLVWLDDVIERFDYYAGWAAGCKLLTYMGSVADSACVWLIVCVSGDRVLLLYYPLRRAHLCSLNSAKKVIFVIIAVSMLWNVWVLILATVAAAGCTTLQQHGLLYAVIQWIDMVMGILVPSVIVFVANFLVIWHLHKFTQTACEQFRAAVKESAALLFNINVELHMTHEHAPVPDEEIEEVDHPDFMLMRTMPNSKSFGEISLYVKRLKERNLTKSLTCVSSLFVLLNLPQYLCRLVLSNYSLGLVNTVLWQLSYYLYFAHHAACFYVYVFNSKQMRKELKPTALQLLECYCMKTVPNFGHSSAK